MKSPQTETTRFGENLCKQQRSGSVNPIQMAKFDCVQERVYEEEDEGALHALDVLKKENRALKEANR
jgi:hypothetical protein